MIGVSQSTVSRTVRRVMNALLQLLPKFIRPPTAPEVAQQKLQFAEKAGFPGIFACVDGTHVKIVRPRVDEEIYVNRKNFHSLNVQIVCNADLFIMDCVARNPGSFHDARVLRESNFFGTMERRPPMLNGLVLGDSGYPIKDWLMTPFPQPDGDQQEAFNMALRRTRVTVERCIGVLKKRWYCLHSELRVEPAVAVRIIYCCCILHNKATMLGLNIDDNIPDVEIEEPQVLPRPLDNLNERARTASGKAVRLQIVRLHF